MFSFTNVKPVLHCSEWTQGGQCHSAQTPNKSESYICIYFTVIMPPLVPLSPFFFLFFAICLVIALTIFDTDRSRVPLPSVNLSSNPRSAKSLIFSPRSLLYDCVGAIYDLSFRCDLSLCSMFRTGAAGSTHLGLWDCAIVVCARVRECPFTGKLKPRFELGYEAGSC